MMPNVVGEPFLPISGSVTSVALVVFLVCWGVLGLVARRMVRGQTPRSIAVGALWGLPSFGSILLTLYGLDGTRVAASSLVAAGVETLGGVVVGVATAAAIGRMFRVSLPATASWVLISCAGSIISVFAAVAAYLAGFGAVYWIGPGTYLVGLLAAGCSVLMGIVLCWIVLPARALVQSGTDRG